MLKSGHLTIPNIRLATHLQAMQQELALTGYNPIAVFQSYLQYLDQLNRDPSTLDRNFCFASLSGDFTVRGATLLLTAHNSLYFSNIALYLRQNLYGLNVPYVLLISRESRNSLPGWKKVEYGRLEEDLKFTVVYAEDRTALRTILKTWKQGGIVQMFVDAASSSAPTARKMVVPFLNNLLQVNFGLFDLAVRNGVDIRMATASEAGLSMQDVTSDNLESTAAAIYRRLALIVMKNPEHYSQWGYIYDRTSVSKPVLRVCSELISTNELSYRGKTFVFNGTSGVVDELRI